MQNWKRLGLLISAGILILALLVLVVAISLSHFLIELWWFFSLDYGGYFWLRLLYRYILSGGVTLGFFALFFGNFWIASGYLGVETPRKSRYSILERFQTGAMEVYTPLALVMAIILAVPFYQQWESGLLFFFGPLTGIEDPVYGNDVTFYLFRLPIFLMIQRGLLITFLLLLVASSILYWIENRVISGKKDVTFPTGAKIHLTVLAVLLTLVEGWRFMLDRFSLLKVDSHEPVFFGPGFVEMRFHLPLIWLSLLFFLGFAFSVIVYFHRRRGTTITVGVSFLICFFIAVGLRHVQIIPDLLEKYIVKANPVTTEGRFMKNNIEATLHAYDLNQATTINFNISGQPETDIAEEIENYITNIPVWDETFLKDVYNQLQGLRPYYEFPAVDVARYPIQGRVQQVNLGTREINLIKLPREAAETWENQHLRYTHGYGIVMTPAAQEGDRPMTWYLRDLTMNSPVGFQIKNPDIYYGEGTLPYVLVPNQLEVTEIAGSRLAPQEYHGGGGVEIKSLFRKLIAAVHFQDPKIFLSINITEESKLRIHRNILERVHQLVPYLNIDGDPYIVTDKNRLYWIVDAYTTSDWYPVSKPSRLPERRYSNHTKEINYIRNSVKIVIDAYDGHVDLYISNPDDPIIRAYDRAFPGVFKPIGAMPLALQAQLRYPRDIFHQQMQIYAKYHQRQPELFYQQAETWNFAQVKDVSKEPYYLTVQLVEQSHPELQSFVQISPMTPIGRDNLSALSIAGVRDLTESPYQPELVVYKFGKEVQVNGPAQIDALIDQSPEISRDFTLWDQRGSQVKRGRIIVLPVGHSILYVQPVYLISEGQTKIPQLTRVIVSMGDAVVMERTLKEAFDKLRRLLQEQTEKETEMRLNEQS
ncbi:MAG: UPF0182 family protein [Methylohalobius sp. ZOD2]